MGTPADCLNFPSWFLHCFEHLIWWCHLYLLQFVPLSGIITQGDTLFFLDADCHKGVPRVHFCECLSTWFDYILLPVYHLSLAIYSFSLACYILNKLIHSKEKGRLQKFILQTLQKLRASTFFFPSACLHGAETSQTLGLLPDISNIVPFSETLTVAVRAH